MTSYADDRVAIAETVAAYSAAANRLAARDMEGVFIADGILAGVAKMVGRADEDVSGARAIGDLFETAFANLEFVHQIPQILEFKVDRDTAWATTAIIEYVRPKGGPLMLMIGNYEDTLVRTAAGWRFSRRNLRVKSFGPFDAP
jgi:hypothetical protein